MAHRQHFLFAAAIFSIFGTLGCGQPPGPTADEVANPPALEGEKLESDGGVSAQPIQPLPENQ